MNRVFAFISRYNALLIYPLWGLMGVLALYWEYTKEQDYLTNELHSQIIFFTDNNDGGTSRIDTAFIQNSEITLAYTFENNKNVFIPFVGFDVANSGLRELHNFDYMEIEIESFYQQTVYIALQMFLEGYSVMGDTATYVTLFSPMPTNQSEKKYRLDLSYFFVPNWWYTKSGYKGPEINTRDLQKVISVSCIFDLQSKNMSNQSSVKSICFQKDNTDRYLFVTTFLLVFTLLIQALKFFYLKALQLKNQKDILVRPYEHLESIKHDESQVIEIVAYIGQNYCNSELSVHDISKKLGMESATIEALLSTSFEGISFKQYVNTIRVHEAKRLLLDTDLNISEICYKVGYRSVKHFNRCFKNIFETTPTDVRRNNG